MRSAISHSEAATSCLREKSGRGKGLMGKELKQKGSFPPREAWVGTIVIKWDLSGSRICGASGHDLHA